MKVAIAGGNGFIGQGLSARLVEMGDDVIWLSYRPSGKPTPAGVTEFAFDPHDASGEWATAVAGADAVVNLSGYPITARWTPQVKELLLSSRVDTSRALIAAIKSAKDAGSGPATYVGACGIGIFGDRGDEVLTEDSSLGHDWLAELAHTWEDEGLAAERAGVRAVVVRTGLVLGTEGLMPRMVLPMKMFVGGPLASGKQWMPWIHYDDITGIYAWAIHTPSVSGPVNACAPHPVRARDFSASLGKALHRPSWFPVPGFALQLILGEVAPYMLYSQNASARKVLDAGYQFHYPELLPALKDVVRNF